MLRILVLGLPDSADAAAALGVRAEHAPLVRLDTAHHTGAAGAEPHAFVVAVGDPGPAGPDLAVDLDLHQDVDLAVADTADAREVWVRRLLPWAQAMVGGAPGALGPARLQPHSPDWSVAGARAARRVRRALDTVPGGQDWPVHHIGSTAVPGLAAKPILDLQLEVPDLPAPDDLDSWPHAVGYVPEVGSRPDSPGVHRDSVRGTLPAEESVWRRRLYVRPDVDQPVVLHVRLAASPWARYTVWFRDWLRADPDARARYERAPVRAREVIVSPSGQPTTGSRRRP